IHKLEAAGNQKVIKKLDEIAKQEFNRQLRLLEERSKLSHEEFLDLLHKQGTTLESMERLERRKFLPTEYLPSVVKPLMDTVGRPEALEYYQTHMNQFWREDSVKWQDLFIAVGPKHPSREEARAFAEGLAGRLKQGEDIKNLLQYNDGSNYKDGE